MTVENKSLIKKKRNIKYFIDAAKTIIENEGHENITIRNVADHAGYNSASIYSYFDNLDHLKYWTSMTYLEDYIEDIPQYIENLDNPCDIYIAVWDCYADYCYKNKDIYYYLFFSPLNDKKEDWAKSYYQMFPLKVENMPEQIERMLTTSDINKRSYYLIEPCIKFGTITKEQAKDIDTLVISVFDYFLNRAKNGSISRDEGLKETKYYIRKIFNQFSK